MEEINVKRSAAELFKRYGDRAGQAAVDQLAAALAEGDMGAYAAWRQITKATAELTAQKLSVSDPGN